MPEPQPRPPKNKKRSKRTDLDEWLGVHRPEIIGIAERDSIRAVIEPVSDGYFRKLLRECGTPLDPLVEGVRQETLQALEHSLLAMPANSEGRNAVIEAKNHARFSLPRHPEKEEMILWMITWLENPQIFASWVKLRREVLDAQTDA